MPTPPPLPPKPKRHKIRIPPKPAAMAQTTVNNYTTFEFKEKDRFVGKDFEIWSARVKSILLDKELWGNVSGQVVKPVPANAGAPTAAETMAMQN